MVVEDGAWGTIHARDIEEGGIIAYEVGGKVVCPECIPPERRDLHKAITDHYLVQKAAAENCDVVCSRCNKAIVKA